MQLYCNFYSFYFEIATPYAISNATNCETLSNKFLPYIRVNFIAVEANL